ncbi:MAG: GNAT family N-acetyltransferase [Halapricum sp.]
MEIKRLSLEEWGEQLPPTGFEVFHTPEALSVLDAHSSGELTLLGGFKGQSTVALLPVFVRSGPIGQVVTSPPPVMGVPRLGPLVMPNSPKRSKREKVTRRFVEGVMEHLDATGSLSIVRIQCPLGFDDPRPFAWNQFDVETSFTYVLDVEDDLETVLGSFNKSLRREFRHANTTDLSVIQGDVDMAKRIVSQVQTRYEEHDDLGKIEWPYARDLLQELGDRSRIYVVRDPDGQFLSGIVALYSNDTVYFWQGGVAQSYEQRLEDGSTRTISVNALLHRTIIEDVLTDPELADIDKYDLVGANTQRLCEYKSKFGPRLEPYYVIESSGIGTMLAKSGFQFVSRVR